KTQLQRFLGSLNYISPFIKDLAKDTALLYERLKKNPKAWTDSHTEVVKRFKQKVNNLPYLTLANPTWARVVETDASDIGYGGILKQCSPVDKQEYLVQFYSGKWNDSQKNYATEAKEMLLLSNVL
uniref:Reverse transcriptase/retrotransposon-derived protein RNase H-like domain-containing protein n=1 Tax=Nicotiana tabacum TaxID=4097 RepID=A0A1S4D1I9_TOBAC